MRTRGWLALVAGGCALCCAPWLLPALTATGLGAWVAPSADALACGAALALLAIAAAALLRRWRPAARRACDCDSACTPTGCDSPSAGAASK